MSSPDPITLELYRHRFAGIAEEMGVTLRRTSYSPNIKERLDFSCALFDARGRMVAQAAHIPVHLGAMPDSVAAAMAAFSSWQPGDVVLLNDPFAGGSHLPDITMISPVFDGERSEPDFFVASRAHHADVGGMSPGSLPLSTELYQEGVIIPPVLLYRAGVVEQGVLDLVLRNVRTPDERRGDLAAQRAAHSVGSRRIQELLEKQGRDEVLDYGSHLIDYSERLTRAAIAGWPEGVYLFEDVIELNDGEREVLVTIRVAASIKAESVTFDFEGTDPQIHGSLNTVLSVTRSACYYVVRALLEEELVQSMGASSAPEAGAYAGGEAVPVNAGCFAPVHVKAPVGSLVNARPPAAVAGGNVETSQRITDTVMGALAQALPHLTAAAGQGTMNNVTMGGAHFDGSPWAYYETIGGGMGAHSRGRGLSGAHVHMSNTLNTPVEALEIAYPLRLTRYALRRGSGGGGLYSGGDGVVREYEVLAPTTVTIVSERRRVPPWGLNGGSPGKSGRNVLIDEEGREEELPAKVTRRLRPGERLRIETPGGGGWGEEETETV